MCPHSYLLMCSVLDEGIEKQESNESAVSSVDDVLMIIKSDYDNAYFVTGSYPFFFIFFFSLSINIFLKDCSYSLI